MSAEEFMTQPVTRFVFDSGNLFTIPNLVAIGCVLVYFVRLWFKPGTMADKIGDAAKMAEKLGLPISMVLDILKQTGDGGQTPLPAPAPIPTPTPQPLPVTPAPAADPLSVMIGEEQKIYAFLKGRGDAESESSAKVYNRLLAIKTPPVPVPAPAPTPVLVPANTPPA